MKIFNHAMRERLARHRSSSTGTPRERRFHVANMRFMATFSDASIGDVEIPDLGRKHPDTLWGNFRYFPIGE